MKISEKLVVLVAMFGCLPLMSSAGVADTTEPVGEIASNSRPACVTLRKLKLETPEVFNNCKEAHTIGLAFFKGDEYVGTEVYHVWQKTARSFKHRGDFVVVDWVKDWTDDGNEDGSKLLKVSPDKPGRSGEDQTWHAQNMSPDRHNAFALKVFYRYWPTAQIVRYVLGPGESAPIVRVNHDAGLVYIQWSRLDPQ
jgi:hypothetical protein